MMTIKLRDYLRLHPNQGVELLTEFGYYTLTKQEIKTQLRKHGAVRSVTGSSCGRSSHLGAAFFYYPTTNPNPCRTAPWGR